MSKPGKLSKEHREAIGPAEEYERVKVPKMFEPAARILVNHVKLRPLDRVLDVACGTGIVARIVAEQRGFAGQISGVDLDPSMLAVARAISSSSGVPIDWREGDALNLPFETDSFDLVLCQQGIQYFTDKVAAIRQMRRVLAADGRVAILVAASIDPEGQPWKWALMQALRAHVGEEAAEKERHPGYFKGGADHLQTLLSDAGFRNVGVETTMTYRGPVGTLEQLIPEADYADLEPETRATVVHELREAMLPYDMGRDSQLPAGLYIATGYK